MDAASKQRERCIQQYMQGWLTQNENMLLETLSPGVHIIESHGPEYEGLSEVRQWFRTWHTAGQVLRWDALRFLHQVLQYCGFTHLPRTNKKQTAVIFVDFQFRRSAVNNCTN